MKILRAILVLGASTAAAQCPPGDPAIRGGSERVELRIQSDAVRVHLEIVDRDLTAILWRQSADADGDGHVSDGELKQFLALERAAQVEYGLLVQVGEENQPLRPLDLRF